MTLRCVLIDDETWTVVPRKATREMFVSGRSALRDNAHRSGRADVAWEAMVRVAPEPPEQKLAWQSELARAHAALREAARAQCEGCRLAWKFSDGWRHTEPMPIICEAQAIRSALAPARETGETK